MELKQEIPGHRTAQTRFNLRSVNDPLLLAILATALGLAVLVVGVAIFWGPGPVLAAIPWYIPMIASFVSLATLCVAFLAFGRYQVLRDPVSFWIGLGFASQGIGQLFYVLAWPGLLPNDGALIARLPNTPAVIMILNWTLFSGLMLAAVLVHWPKKQTLPGRRWMGLAAAWLIFVALTFSLLVVFETYLPMLSRADGTFTPLLRILAMFLLLLVMAGSFLSTRYYWHARDALAGYVAFAQMALVFLLLMTLIGGKRYDLWWYLQRVIGVSGYLIVLLGLLSEYVGLLNHEREGRLMLDAILENIPVGLAVTGGPPDFTLAHVSRYGVEMNRRPAEGLVGKTAGEHQAAWKIFLPDGITEPLPEQMPLFRASRLGEQTRNLELLMVARDGQKIPVLVNAAPVLNVQGQIVAAINAWLDITERKQVEEALSESEARYRTLFESMDEGFCIVEVLFDTNGHPNDYRFLETNPAFTRQTGLEAVVGKRMRELSPLHEPHWYETYGRVVLTGKSERFTNKARDLDNRWYDVYVFPVGSPNERKVAILSNDITERKRTEDALAQAALQLERSNRELEQYAFIASHDLQEPLRKIKAFGDSLLESTTNLDDRDRDYVERMCKAANRMQGLVDGLLQLSRVTTQGQPFVPVDLSQVASEVLSDLDHQVRRTGGTVEVGQLPVVTGDPLQLRLLLQNLISNALKYHKPGMPPQVKVCAKQLSAGVQIQVQDNGIGFNLEKIEEVFRPFQRLVGRSDYEGSGMGLAICRRIVERHGGEITAQGELGQGATFIVTLPNSLGKTRKNDIES